jgi:hypothetical protein
MRLMGLGAAARNWLMVWMPHWPFMVFASILLVMLSFVVAAVVAPVAALFRANVLFRQVFQGLSYSCPPAYTLALRATLWSVWAPMSNLAGLVGLIANAWYVAWSRSLYRPLLRLGLAQSRRASPGRRSF